MHFNTNTKIVGILAIVFLIVLLAKHFIIGTWINDSEGFSINLLSEIIGAILTFIVVDTIIKSENASNRKKITSSAFSSLKQPLKRYANMWLHIYNSNESFFEQELQQCNALRDYFTSDAFVSSVKARSFDDLYSSNTYYTQPSKLNDIIPEIRNKFKSDISDILTKYSYAFDPDTIQLLQHFAESAHLYQVINIGHTINLGFGNNHWFSSISKENIREHLSRFVDLIDMYNANVLSNEKLTCANIAAYTRISGNVTGVKW